MRSNEKLRELYIRNKWIILIFLIPFFCVTSFYNVNTNYILILAGVFLLYCLLGFRIMNRNTKAFEVFKVIMPYIDLVFCGLVVLLRGGFRTDAFMIFILSMALYSSFESAKKCIRLCIFSMILYASSCLYYVSSVNDYYWEGFFIRLTFMPITLLITLHFSKKVNSLKSNLAEEMLNARKDTLTGLWNRKMLNEMLKKMSSECKNNRNTKYGILIIDLDDFKSINDNYGHDKGDFVLMNVAHCISQNLLSKDIPFRLGGDEFLILIKDCDKYKLKQYADRIRSSIDRLRFNFGNSLIGITVSIGGSLSTEGNFDEMFKLSDERMYHGKTNGKNMGITC